MNNVLYDDIYSKFLLKITDYSFASLDPNDAYEMMLGYLHNAVAVPYISKIFSSAIFDDEILTLTYELKNEIFENGDVDYVTNILATGMVIQWLEPQVKSVLHTLQMFGGKEEKFYSQAAHLSELKSLLKDCKVELRKMIRDRGYISNS